MSRDWRDNVGSPGLVISAAGSVSTSFNKIDRGVAGWGITIPGGVNSYLFVEVSFDNSNFYKVRDPDGNLIYFDPSSVTETQFWCADANTWMAYHVRLVSCTNANGTAGSALATGGTFVVMGMT